MKHILFLLALCACADFSNAQWEEVIPDMSNNNLSGVDYLNEQEAIIWTQTEILHTYDNWKNHEVITSFPRNHNIYWVDFDDSRNGYALVRLNTVDYTLLKTTNGGYSWEEFEGMNGLYLKSPVIRKGDIIYFSGSRICEVNLLSGEVKDYPLTNHSRNQGIQNVYVSSTDELYFFAYDNGLYGMKYNPGKKDWDYLDPISSGKHGSVVFLGEDKIQFSQDYVWYEFDCIKGTSDTLRPLENIKPKGGIVTIKVLNSKLNLAQATSISPIGVTGAFLYDYSANELIPQDQATQNFVFSLGECVHVKDALIGIQGSSQVVMSNDSFFAERRSLFSQNRYGYVSMNFTPDLGVITSSFRELIYTTDQGKSWTRTTEVPFNSFQPNAVLINSSSNNTIFTSNGFSWLELEKFNNHVGAKVVQTLTPDPKFQNLRTSLVARDNQGNLIVLKTLSRDYFYLFQSESKSSELKFLGTGALNGYVENSLVVNEDMIAWRTEHKLYLYNRKTSQTKRFELGNVGDVTIFKGKLYGIYGGVHVFSVGVDDDKFTKSYSFTAPILYTDIQLWAHNETLYFGLTNRVVKTRDLVHFDEIDVYEDGRMAFVQELKVWQNDLYLATSSGVYRRSLTSSDDGLDSFNLSIRIRPNPMHGSGVVQITSKKEQDVSLRLINFTGQVCLEERRSILGVYQWNISTTQLNPGVYLFEVATDANKEVKKIVLQ